MSKKLVTYFSAGGVTERTAEKLAELAGADLYEIKPEEKYTTADLNYMDPNSRSSREVKTKDFRPPIVQDIPDLSGYDAVYIGFPIWWYTAPQIINTFIESCDLNGIKVGIFATSGGTGINGALKDLEKKYPDVEFAGAELMNRGVKDFL